MVRVFPPLIALVAIGAGVALQFWIPIRAGSLIRSPARYWVGGAIALGAFLLLGLWSILIYRRTGQNPDPRTPTPVIVEAGPFRVTRNPMYLQLVLVTIGIAVVLANVWILLLTPVVAWLLQRLAILPEERYLERKFGDAYLAYKRRVRRWI